jgi:hypothetical protein
MFLAGIVVVPFEVIVIVLSHNRSVATTTALVLALANLALVNPCITALVMQALIDLGEARRPRIPDVMRRGLTVLPVVAAAQIVAGLSEFAVLLVATTPGGVLALIPAVILAVRLAVAPQVAATEKTNWPGAIRRSVSLTRRNFWRVFGLLAIEWLLTSLVAVIIGNGRSVAAAIVGLVLGVVAQSFCTLLISLLYFDLRARDGARVA